MLAVDANILVRAVLGKRARSILQAYSGVVRFLVSEAAVDEARSHLPEILARRGLDPQPALTVLEGLIGQLEVVEVDVYRARENDARRRLINRDIDDWADPGRRADLRLRVDRGHGFLGPVSRHGRQLGLRCSCTRQLRATLPSPRMNSPFSPRRRVSSDFRTLRTF